MTRIERTLAQEYITARKVTIRSIFLAVLITVHSGYSDPNITMPVRLPVSGDALSIFDCDKPSAEIIYRYAKRIGIRHPDILVRQIILETGHLTSYAMHNYNNYTGFSYRGKLMQFSDWKECIEAYKKWQDKRYIDGDYYKFIADIGYAEDTLYISKLKSIDINKHSINID